MVIRFDLITLVLLGLIAESALQLVPMPVGVVRIIAPSRASSYEQLQPLEQEQFAGEPSSRRPGMITISVNPYVTKQFMLHCAVLLLLYCVVRNWLATKESFKRFIWLAIVNGILMSTYALGAHLSSPHLVYWSFDVQGRPFGPFVNRSNFTDYMAFCLGWTLGAIFATQQQVEAEQSSRQSVRYSSGPLEFLSRPAALLSLSGLSIMAVALLFSRSRGGIIALAFACVGFLLMFKRNESSAKMMRALILLLAISLLGGIAWFGRDSLQERFTLQDDRMVLWKRSVALAPGFWLFGSGQGTFDNVETINRPYTEFDLYARFQHAHNEYVEALLEGGIIRLGLVLTLVLGLLWSLGNGYRARYDRSVGPYILGCWFALLVLAAHAVTDFSIHIPAVAIMAVSSLAFANSAAHDPEYSMVKRRTKKRSNSPSKESLDAESIAGNVEDKSPFAKRLSYARPNVITGYAIWIVGGTATLIALLMTIQAWSYFQGQKYLYAANKFKSMTDLTELQRKLEYLDAARSWLPNDPHINFHYGMTHHYLAIQLRPPVAEAVAGPILPGRIPLAHRLPDDLVQAHVMPGLRAIRQARDLCPYRPEYQMRLGLMRQYFARSESALTYFQRARFLMPGDPNIWFACGTEEFQAKNYPQAIECWKKSIEISPIQLRQILVLARSHWTPKEIIDKILPVDPEVYFDSIDQLSDREPEKSRSRQQLLETIVKMGNAGTWKWKQWAAIAKANEQLGIVDVANNAWLNALTEAPEEVKLRLELVEYYERDEQFSEAEIHLKWLILKFPNNASYRERLTTAAHGSKLQRIIRGE